MGNPGTPPDAEAVLDFWFRESEPRQWFSRDAAFDEAIQSQTVRGEVPAGVG